VRVILLILLIVIISPFWLFFWIVGFIYEKYNKEPDEDIESIEDLFIGGGNKN